MHLLTLFMLSIYLKYVKVEKITFTHVGRGHVTDDKDIGEVVKQNGYYEYNVEDEEHEVHYMNIRIVTKLEFRIAVKDRRRFWADGVVPYELSKKYDSKEKNAILAGMEAFKRATCIRFIPKTNEAVYIFIEPGTGCSATIGKFDKNAVKLGKGCYKKGIVIHELMHVLGFLHEQSRPDRDTYVKINYDNILEKHKKNFDKSPKNQIQSGNISYDYDSIMHYGPFTFAKNKNVRTVIPLQEGAEIGQREDFSKKDIQKINIFYHCEPQGRRRRVKRHENHGPVSQGYFNNQESSLPVVVGSQYSERRKSVPAYPTDVRRVDFGSVRASGEYSLPNYSPVQNPRPVYQPAAYPSSGYSLEERRIPSYPSSAYAKPAQPVQESYDWPSYSAVEQPKVVYPPAEQSKILYAPAEYPKIVYPPAEQPQVEYPQAEPPISQNRDSYSPVNYSPVEYRRTNYRPTYSPVKYPPRPSYTTSGYQRLPYPPLDYPKPAYARPSYTTAGYRRPPYRPPYYRQDSYPSMYGYPPVVKPYTEPNYETTLTTDPSFVSIAPTATEQGSTTVTLTTDNTTPTVTATTPVTTNQESTTLEMTTPMETTTTVSTVTETTTLITTEGTSTVVTSTTAETTTSELTSTVADTTTVAPTSTVADTTTVAPTSTVADITTVAPTSTVADTTTVAPTSTVADTTTVAPTSTVADTTTVAPTSTVADTTTVAPTSTVTETTTAVPTSTVTETTTAVPTSTVTETTTAATTEGSSTVETTTKLETTNATEEDIDSTKSTTIDYGYIDKENEPKDEYYELSSRGMEGFVSDRNIHSTPYHRIRIFPNIQGRTALRDPSAFWPRGIVPYEFSDKYDDQQKGFLLEAMQEFHNKTCVRFIPRRNQASYIFVEPEVKCSATIGKVPGQVNRVRISEGCYLQGTIIHELMHTLGFVHEQNRPDRDRFVIVMFDNIIPEARRNFRKYTWDEVQDLGQSYDYDSVMHYNSVEFAKDPDRPTLVPLQSGVTLGQRDGFSVKDLLKINKLYKCRIVQAKQPVTSSPIEEFKKYFQSNIQRLFRNLLRAIQNFKPTRPK